MWLAYKIGGAGCGTEASNSNDALEGSHFVESEFAVNRQGLNGNW